jgi:hypothetical protein
MGVGFRGRFHYENWVAAGEKRSSGWSSRTAAMKAIFLANCVGNIGKIIALEASPHNSAILRKHIEPNHISPLRKQCVAPQPDFVRITEESAGRMTQSQGLRKGIEATITWMRGRPL